MITTLVFLKERGELKNAWTISIASETTLLVVSQPQQVQQGKEEKSSVVTEFRKHQRNGSLILESDCTFARYKHQVNL